MNENKRPPIFIPIVNEWPKKTPKKGKRFKLKGVIARTTYTPKPEDS